jgi:hypothetical protein
MRGTRSGALDQNSLELEALPPSDCHIVTCYTSVRACALKTEGKEEGA